MTSPVDYVRHGWVLVPIPEGQKGPTAKGWNTRDRCVSTEERAARLDANIGLAHAYSGTCSIDFDDLERAAAYLKEHQIDVNMLLKAPDAVRISSGRANRAKLLYRLETPLPSLKLVEYTADDGKKYKALELRCATSKGTTVQDVLPPSIHPDTGKPYAWEYGDELIGDWRNLPTIPDALLKLWQSLLAPANGLDSAHKASSGAQEINFEFLRQTLAGHNPDAGYDDWLKVGMALHHETDGGPDGFDLWNEWSAKGSKYKGSNDLEPHWRSFRNDGNRLITLASLRTEIAAAADEFDVVAPETTSATIAEAGLSRFRLIPAAEFAQGRDVAWLVRNVIPQAELVVVYGESGSGKSFLILDLVAAIARGVTWRDLRTVSGPVVYICAEGVAGFRRRLRAYSHQTAVPLDDLRLKVIGDAPNLLEGKDALAVAKHIAEDGGASVIVVDTLSAVTPGANENAGEDMGTVIAHCKGLHRATGATVILIHHSGKDAAKGARGWSGLRAAADAEIEVIRHGEASDCTRTATVTKQKDGEDGAIFGFKLAPVLLGVNDEGEDITSCVIEHVEAPKQESKSRELGGVERDVFKVLSDMMPLDGGGSSVDVEDLIAGVIKGMVKNESGKDQRRGRVRRALESLARSEIIGLQDGRVSLQNVAS